VTVRYSTRVPSGRAEPLALTSWNTRGVVSSAVPRWCHSSVPTARQAKEVSAQASSMPAATGATPDRAAPGRALVPGTTVTVPAESAPTVRSATSTIADRAGTVRVTAPSASAVTVASVPYSGANVAPGVRESNVTVRSAPALLAATRCSIRSSRCTRENA
jgi:hypothetical protein